MILGSSLKEGLELRPIDYEWAYDLYQQAVRNTWFPHEIQLGEDIVDWKSMTDEERNAIEYFIGFFNPSELFVNKALALGVYPYLSAAEAHLYIAKQMWEEANHCVGFEYVLETFPIDRQKIYRAHIDIPEIKAKEDFETKYLRRMIDDKLDIETVEGKQDFVRNLVAYNIIMEGIWFYGGFLVGLSFRQRNLMRNFGDMIDWVLRDESLHLKFGINLLLTILEENPEILTEEFVQEIKDMIIEAVELEERYNQKMLPKGILGLNADIVNKYIKYVTDRRLEELGFGKHYNEPNPAKWMTTATDVYELVNFFEAQNTSYEVNAESNT